MPMTITGSSGSEFKNAPPGMHVARCYFCVDLGLQPGSKMYPAPKQVVRLGWEIPGERTDDDRPISIFREYTKTLGPRGTLRKDLASWRGRDFTPEELLGFDLFSIVGAPATLNVVHNQSGDRTYANVASVSPLLKGTECPPMENDPVKFSIDEWDQAEFDKLSDWLQGRINTRMDRPDLPPERALPGPGYGEEALVEDESDRLPF